MADHGDAHERQVDPLLHRVAPADHHDHVDRDERHAAEQHGHVVVDHLVQHVVVAAQRHRVDLHPGRQGPIRVQHSFDELHLPVRRVRIRLLQQPVHDRRPRSLHPAVLVVLDIRQQWRDVRQDVFPVSTKIDKFSLLFT